MDCNMPGFPVHHQLLEFTQSHVHWVSDTIQPSHPLSSPSPSAFNIKLQKAFKNQNEVTVVQASKMQPGGCGFKHFPASLRTWIFWTVSNTRASPAILKIISVSSCKLQPCGFKDSPCNSAKISNPNQSLLNSHLSFLPAPILIFDN